MLDDHRIAAKNCLLTTRAAKWATVQVGTGRTVKEVAGELACDWHTVNDAVTTYGKALLEADRKRLNKTTAIGLDETTLREARSHSHTDYATTVGRRRAPPDHRHPARAATTSTWRAGSTSSPRAWKERIGFGALDMSATYAAVYSVILPKAAQVVDPFHVVSLANRASTQSAAGSRPSSSDTGDDATTRSIGRAGSCSRAKRSSTTRPPSACAHCSSSAIPSAEVAIAYRVKERLRDFYRDERPRRGPPACSKSSQRHCLKRAMPPEIQKLGRTIRTWFDKICNYHLARMSNGPTEALNNLIKRIKRIGFGFRNFENYRIRALLYAGKPNWRVLGSIVVR